MLTGESEWNSTQTAYLDGMMVQYGMNQTEIINMYSVLYFQAQNYLFLGTTGTFPVSSII